MNIKCQSAIHAQQNISKVRNYLVKFTTTKALVQACVISKLDIGNALWYGAQSHLLYDLQRKYVRLTCKIRKRAHITQCSLAQLHCIHKQCIEFIILPTEFNSLTIFVPEYLQPLVKRYIPARDLRSSPHNLLVCQPVRLKNCACRAWGHLVRQRLESEYSGRFKLVRPVCHVTKRCNAYITNDVASFFKNGD